MSKSHYILGEKHVVNVLIFLWEEEKTTKTGFKSISTYYKSVAETAERLEKRDLVEIEHQEKPFSKTTYWLTDKGKETAKKLKELETELKEK